MNDLAVQLDGVGKDYRFFSLNDIRLELPYGHIMGFIGPNGAGKSTTLRILMGLVHQDRGDVRVLGQPMPAGQVAAKWDVGFASEDMRLYDGATLDWHLRLIRSIYPSWDQAYAQTLLKRFDLRPEQRMKGMSHGQRVKATLLLVLARRPRLLVLDEPTTGLDPVARHEVLARIRVELPGDVDVPALPGIIGVIQTGRLAVATTNAFYVSLARAYEAAGIRVHAVEAMTLEEIFVTNVQYSREGVAV